MTDHTKRTNPLLVLLAGPFLGIGIGFLYALGEIAAREMPLSPYAAVAAPFYGGAGLLFGFASAVAALLLRRRRPGPFLVAGTAVALPLAAKLLEIAFERLPHGVAPATVGAGLGALLLWLALTLAGAFLLRFVPRIVLASAPGAAAIAAILLFLAGSPEHRREIGETGGGEEDRPNVILILVDTLRADRLGAYGHPRATSIHIDRMAEDGILFADAYAQCSWTKPSVVSILSSRYPFAYGRNDLYHRVPEEARFLSEAFAEAGYRTGAIVANPVVSPSLGFDQGFESYDHGYLTLSGMRIYRYLLWLDLLAHPGLTLRGDVVAGKAVRWIDDHREEPFFLYLHFMDPHEPYAPGVPYDRLFRDRPLAGRKTLVYPRPEALPFDARPNPYGEEGLRELVDRYDGETRRVDDAVGRIVAHLRERGLYEDGVIALIADHGEEFLEHGGWGHGQSLYGELTGVPFVLKPPGGKGPRGIVETRRVMMVDVAPTLLSLAGVAADPRADGVDLLAFPGERPAVGDVTAGEARILSVRRGDRHFVIARRGEERARQLFDVADDPGETADVAPGAPAAADSLAFYLDSLLAATEAIETEATELPEGTVEQLRGLGYLQ